MTLRTKRKVRGSKEVKGKRKYNKEVSVKEFKGYLCWTTPDDIFKTLFHEIIVERVRVVEIELPLHSKDTFLIIDRD